MAEKDATVLDKLGVNIGTKVSHQKTVTEADIVMFAGVSGDFNLVHTSEEYAKKTLFGGRIAHGVISLGFVSAAMTKLPGVVIFLSASDRFLAPVRIGDTITATGEVINARKDKGIVTLKTTCTNQKGEVVVEGEWTVRLYEVPS
jgi:3-hydroxybutyryl-CoA dehydratase